MNKDLFNSLNILDIFAYCVLYIFFQIYNFLHIFIEMKYILRFISSFFKYLLNVLFILYLQNIVVCKIYKFTSL